MILPASGSWTMKSMNRATSSGCGVRAEALGIREARYRPVCLPVCLSSVAGIGARPCSLSPSAVQRTVKSPRVNSEAPPPAAREDLGRSCPATFGR
ncbi:hypothetical protein GCM10010389_49920 [Streptomyces echinoruber]|uniref:Uncharacterized protein n=1 Tax=Streptomyces echinoruber TaxID=68898 RepID=A0A918RLP6_9ACTN|nr:hypothetical protein GCM10010389_49920 [Streptomyces echinoruber]